MSDQGGVHHHLAHINVARFKRPKADIANADFLTALDDVNAAAEAGDGLVWRFTAAAGDPADRQAAEDPYRLANLSVWTGLEALKRFTYRDPLHRAMMRRRREWFERLEVRLALWWVPAGTRPTLIEALDRLERLAGRGPTAAAFTFALPFDPSGLAVVPSGHDAA
ncbi:MAG: DUF3291 domain-containing protein [Janthinobacterium lividum]